MDVLNGVELNSLPVWVIAVVIALRLLPATVKELGVFVPSLGQWVEVRQAKVHHELNSHAAEQAHDVLIDTKLLTLLEESLKQSWHAQEELETRMRQVVQEVQRTNALVSVLNITITKMCDKNIELLGYLKERNSDDAGSENA